MAAIVQQHSLPESRPKAAADTDRVRKFILKRKGEILADITPEPPDWPEPSVEGQPPGWGGRFDSGEIDLRFETTWGSNKSDNPFAAGGRVTNFLLEGVEQSLGWVDSHCRSCQSGRGCRLQCGGSGDFHRPRVPGRRVH